MTSEDHPQTGLSPVVRLTRYGQPELNEILGDGPDPFRVAEWGLTWRAKDVHFGIRSGDRLVAHTGLVRIPATIGDVPVDLVGFGGVAVAADLRGHGLARLVVGAAEEHARTLGPSFGLLFCRPELVPLYERLGWRPVAAEVEVEQPDGLAVMPLHTLWRPLREGAHWPAGAVRLRSLPM